LTLQKLVQLRRDEASSGYDSDRESPYSVGESRKGHRRGRFSKIVQKMFSSTKGKPGNRDDPEPVNLGDTPTCTNGLPGVGIDKLRTLRKYHGGPNHERMAFMQAHSALTKKGLAVSAEQVSIFLTAGKCYNHL
jgi:hypothetical protein